MNYSKRDDLKSVWRLWIPWSSTMAIFGHNFTLVKKKVPWTISSFLNWVLAGGWLGPVQGHRGLINIVKLFINFIKSSIFRVYQIYVTSKLMKKMKSEFFEIFVHFRGESMVLKCWQDLWQMINIELFRNVSSRVDKANSFQNSCFSEPLGVNMWDNRSSWRFHRWFCPCLALKQSAHFFSSNFYEFFILSSHIILWTLLVSEFNWCFT